LLAAGCANRNPQGEPVVRVHSSASGGVETLSYTMHVKLVDSVNGQSAETPPLKVAFRFDGGNVIARVDMPTSYFPDGKARILLMDQTNRRSAVLLRHGLQPDPQLDSESLAEALFGNSYELGLFDPDRPFRRLSAADFSKRMRGLSFDVVQSNQHRLVATRAFTDAQGEERKFTLIFDDAVGAVVEAVEEGNLPGLSYKSESQVNYTSQTLDDGSELVVPYEINTSISGNLQGEEELPTVEMPTADTILADGEEIQLADDEYIAKEFSAMPGEGSVDPNVQIQNVQVRMEDIQVNQESEDYFLTGRW